MLASVEQNRYFINKNGHDAELVKKSCKWKQIISIILFYVHQWFNGCQKIFGLFYAPTQQTTAGLQTENLFGSKCIVICNGGMAYKISGRANKKAFSSWKQRSKKKVKFYF